MKLYTPIFEPRGNYGEKRRLLKEEKDRKRNYDAESAFKK